MGTSWLFIFKMVFILARGSVGLYLLRMALPIHLWKFSNWLALLQWPRRGDFSSTVFSSHINLSMCQVWHCPKVSPSKVTLLCLWALQAEVNQEEFVERLNALVGFRLQAVPNIKRCYFLCMVSRFYYSLPSNKTWNYDDSFYEGEYVCLYIFSKTFIVASFSPSKVRNKDALCYCTQQKIFCGSGTQVRLE